MTREPPADQVGYRKPPAATRFVKGRSGNPSGRPKARAKRSARSPFDVVMDQILTIQRNGVACEVSAEEALRHALLQKAFAGNRTATKTILRMIDERQSVIAAMAPPPEPRPMLKSGDPDNANEALVLLGIAEASNMEGHPRLKLLPWAVQAALDRRGGPKLNEAQQTQIARRMTDANQVTWPRPAGQ